MARPRSGTSRRYGLIREKSQHLSFGEFSSKFAKAAALAPWLAEPSVITSDPGSRPSPVAEDGVDAYAWAHNETSTAVMAPVLRPEGAADDALVLVDATSGAGGLPVDLDRGRRLLLRAAEVLRLRRRPLDRGDVAGRARAGRARSPRSDRHIPAFFDLPTAIDNSRKNQTYNTPSVATLFLMAEQLDWMNAQGGLDRHGRAHHRVVRRALRLGREDGVHHAVRRRPRPPLAGDRHHRLRRRHRRRRAIAATLRANGIVDTEPYRKLGRNQLRIAMYPAIDPSDVEALTACIDFVVERL